MAVGVQPVWGIAELQSKESGCFLVRYRKNTAEDGVVSDERSCCAPSD